MYWWTSMSFESSSPNMGLVLPGVSLTEGPQWAADVNASLSIIDQHNHSAGNGVQITPAGLNLNTDVSFLSNNAITLRSVRMVAQGSPLAGSSDLGCIYVSGVDLYYNDENGNQIQITQSGGVAGTPGSIANLVSPASASYVSADSTFVWQSDVSTPAIMDFGSAILRNMVANSKGLTLQPPNAMGADYILTLPSLPASQKIMTLDASGNMSAPWDVDGTTIEVNSNTIRVVPGGIGPTQLANDSVDETKLTSSAINNSIQTSTIVSSGNFTVPVGVTKVWVSGCGEGGGGGGGASSTTTAGGGGGGEGAPWYEGMEVDVTPLAVIAVTVGTGGGSGGAAVIGGNQNGNNGGSGNSSLFGSFLNFRGGRGGSRGLNAGAGGSGGSDTGGNPSIGSYGGIGGTNNSVVAAGGSSSVFGVGGSGGSSGNSSGAGGGGGGTKGTGGTGGNSGSPDGQAGTNATSYGSGGGGGGGANGGGNGANGGNGYPGIVIVRWFES